MKGAPGQRLSSIFRRYSAAPETAHLPGPASHRVDDLAQILNGLAPLRLRRAERETVARFRSMPVRK
jgi:hypothetical protein